MSEITSLLNTDWPSVFSLLFLLMIGILAIRKVLNEFFGWTGLETKWERRRRKERELLNHTVKQLWELENRHTQDMNLSQQSDQKIMESLNSLIEKFNQFQKELQEELLNERVETNRHTILDFANAVSNGKKVTQEHFSYILKKCDEYEDLIRKHQLINGQASMSIAIIHEKYKENIESGIFKRSGQP